jgi:hypothetical protein
LPMCAAAISLICHPFARASAAGVSAFATSGVRKWSSLRQLGAAFHTLGSASQQRIRRFTPHVEFKLVETGLLQT